jgi:hypothetical protein
MYTAQVGEIFLTLPTTERESLEERPDAQANPITTLVANPPAVKHLPINISYKWYPQS